MPSGSKPRKHILIRVYTSPTEKALIQSHAKESGLTDSSYLKSLGLGHSPPAVIDIDAAMELSKSVANLGRFGGLLKLWLSDDKKLNAIDPKMVKDAIFRLLPLVRENQNQMREIIKAVTASRGNDAEHHKAIEQEHGRDE